MGSDWAPAITMSIVALSVSTAFAGVHERLDFAERMLAKHRGAERLDAPR